MDTNDRPYNETWDDPDTHDGEYPPDWTARCHKAFEEHDHTCQNCGWQGGPHSDDPKRRLYGKHIIPPASGGEHTISNIAVVCSDCYTPETDTETPTEKDTATPEPEPRGSDQEDPSGEAETITAPRVPDKEPRSKTQSQNVQHPQQVQQNPQQEYNRFTELVSKIDLFAETPDEYGRFTLYQTVVRLGLMASIVAIAVMFFYQIAVTVQTTLNTVTETYTLLVYTAIIVLPWVVAWFVDFKVGPTAFTADETPSTHYVSVKVMMIVMTICLTLYYVTQPYLPTPGVSGEIYGTLTVGVLAVIYLIAAGITILSILSGSLEARYGIGISIRPMIWIGVLGSLTAVYLWTWLIIASPYATTEVVQFVLPDVAATLLELVPGSLDGETVTRGQILQAVTVLLPSVAIAYMARLRVAVWQQKRQYDASTPEETQQ